jgi:hypothetical protein
MKKLINIVIHNTHDPEIFKSRLTAGDSDIDFHINNFDYKIIWDLVVFWNQPKKPYCFNIINGASVFISGEPFLMIRYCKSFLNQFKYTISSYKINKKNHYEHPPYIPWFYGWELEKQKLNYDIRSLREMKPLSKTKVISIITSQKNFMPGHIKRTYFINELKKRYQNEIDFYGNESLKLNDKAEGINDYKFHLCFENSIGDNYWTEKLSDPILGFSIPIYYGCNNIENFFNGGIIKIDLDDTKASLNIIGEIIKNSDVIYSKMKNDLIENRKIILNDQNLISFIKKFYFDKVIREKKIVEKIKINSFDYFKINTLINYSLRLRRLSIKLLILIKIKIQNVINY